MLEKVQTIWIDGYLKRSLFEETRILLGLSESPDAVMRPLDLLVARTDQGERPLPPGKRIVDVFDEMDQALLILGNPGSGKTTLLLELARDLLERASGDAAHPIPVVFPLSTWAEKRLSLAEWLVDELNKRYDVPLELGQEWVNKNQILLLLDGLDEVKQEHRKACVEAINAFRQSQGLFPHLAICSRTADYHGLATKLRLQSAIVVQPLTHPQVDSYLTAIEPLGTAVREAIRHDPTLWDLLDTPLMLYIVIVAYAGGQDPRLQVNDTPKGRRKRLPKRRRNRLFAAYVDQMFRRRSADHRYTPQQTVRWLRWLARQMVRRSQTVFYIERLQPDWLPEEERWAFGLVNRLIPGAVFGLVGGLAFGLLGGLGLGLDIGLGFGLIGLSVGLIGGLLIGSIVNPNEIIYIDNIRYSVPRIPKNILIVCAVFGLGLGFLIGTVSWLAGALVGGLRVDLMLGDRVVRLSAEIGGGLGGLSGMFVFPILIMIKRGVKILEINIIDKPNQGIHRSARNALFFGLISALVLALVEGLAIGLALGFSYDLVVVPGSGLSVGLFVGLMAGGQACLQHFVLRLLLVRNGSAPWNYARFLDHAVERILLRKVGGGYIFIHRMLMEYFGAQHDESPT